MPVSAFSLANYEKKPNILLTRSTSQFNTFAVKSELYEVIPIVIYILIDIVYRRYVISW